MSSRNYILIFFKKNNRQRRQQKIKQFHTYKKYNSKKEYRMGDTKENPRHCHQVIIKISAKNLLAASTCENEHIIVIK